MKRLKTIFSLQPKIASDRPTDNASDVLSYAGLDKPIARLRRLLRNIRIFTLGTANETVQRPVITSSDSFWLLVNLHLNIRFIANYIDLSLEWGGFLVWIVFTLTNLTICSCFGSIYTFLGCYGDRSFLKLWSMMPMFQGISICVTIFEALKIMENSVIISSGLMSFADYFHYGDIPNSPSTPIRCNRSKFLFEPAIGVPYGMSKRFTDYGHEYAKLTHWKINERRANWMFLVYFCVIFLRIFKFKRYRFYPMRVNVFCLFVTITWLIILNRILIPTPLSSIIQYEVEKYTNVHAYLQIIMFSAMEYMPMHWVTIGYLCPRQPLKSKIWIIAAIKILFTFFLLYWIPFVAAAFKTFTNVERSECLQFFGIHFIFIMVPTFMKTHLFPNIGLMFYVVYIILIVGHGVTYILISIEMFEYSFVTDHRMLYRYRNMVYVLCCIVLASLSYLFCITNAHYFLFYLNTKSHFFTIMVINTMSTLGLAVYGLDRINGDYLFMKGVLYPHLTSLKLVFLFTFGFVLIFLSEAYFYDYRNEDSHIAYWAIMGICTCPLMFGFWRACAFRHRFHGLFQPLSKWGMPSAALRNQRRRRTVHTMYTYRMRRDCQHNCLMGNQVLFDMIDNNLDLQEQYLGLRRYNKLRLAMERKSKDSELN